MKKDIRIFAIPTKNASNIKFISKGEYEEIDGKLVELKKDKYHYFEESSKFGYPSTHLYATTDEIPKDGDWQINHLTDKISQRTNSFLEISVTNCSKVVATTDMYLNTTDKQNRFVTQLPQISPEFQQAWVKSMNDNVPIVDALMEYEYGIINEGNPTCADLDSEKPKLNSQAYVTILPKVNKVYSREEVIDMLWGIRTFYHQHSNLSFNKIRPLFKELINRNL